MNNRFVSKMVLLQILWKREEGREETEHVTGCSWQLAVGIIGIE